MKSREVEVRGAEAKGEADALKPLVPIGDEGDARRLVWLEGGESSRRSMLLSPRVTAVSKNVSSNR